MLVLLIIFMVAAPLMMVGVPVDLPRTSAAKLSQPRKPVIVSISKDGKVFVGEEEAPAAELIARLGELRAKDPNAMVYVRGDRTIPVRPGDGGHGTGRTGRLCAGLADRGSAVRAQDAVSRWKHPPAPTAGAPLPDQRPLGHRRIDAGTWRGVRRADLVQRRPAAVDRLADRRDDGPDASGGDRRDEEHA